MSVKIQEITNKDLLEVEQLYCKSIVQNPDGFIQRLDLLPNIKDFILTTKKQGGNFFSLRLEEEIIGMCGLIKKNDLVVELCKFHIKDIYQGRGFGGKMLDFVQEYAKIKGYKKLILHVSKSQERAIALYKKHLFKITSEEICEVILQETIYTYPTLFMEKIL